MELASGNPQTPIDYNLLEPAKDFVRGIVDEWSIKARDALWDKGQEEMMRAKSLAEAKNAELEASLAKFRERQEALAAENRMLRGYVKEFMVALEAASAAEAGVPIWPAFDPLRSPATLSLSQGRSYLTPDRAVGGATSETPSTAATTSGSSVEPRTLSLAMALSASAAPDARRGAPLALDAALKANAAAASDRDPIKASVEKSPALGAIAADAPGTHTLTLQKTNETGLGMDVSHCDSGVIVVEGVNPNGAAALWNEEQRRRARDDKSSYTPFEVRAGDHIVRVNNVSGNAAKMLDECKANDSLTIVVRRARADSNGTALGTNTAAPKTDFLGADSLFSLGKAAEPTTIKDPPGLEKLGTY